MIKKFNYYQYVLIEWHNSQHEIFKIVSDNPITFNIVKAYLTLNCDYNDLEDSIVFIDRPNMIIL